MDLLRLDRSTFFPDTDPLLGYNSLIWTERYLTPGEFELHTPDISGILATLPRGSLVTHRETPEVMMVETHQIQDASEGGKELVVKGRSLTAFTENRYLEGPYPNKKYKMARNYTPSEAACVLLWNAFVNDTENDVTRIGPGGRSTLDKIENVLVTNSASALGERKRRWLTGGQLYPQISDLLRQNKLGVRMVRPYSSSDFVVSVTTGDKGIISYDERDSIQKLRFDVYSGKDRRRQQTTNEPVIFHYGSGHIDNPSYLWSIQNFKTMMLVVSSVGTKTIYRNRADDKDLSGLDRRPEWMDGGEPGDPDFPHDATDAEKDEIRAQNRADFLDDLRDAAATELDKTDETHVFDGQITPAAPYTYGVDYFLGDKITLLAEYDFDQMMRVSEYIRTEDKTGDRGYPTLVVSFEDDSTA